jgi:hypothetical protein
MFEFLSANLKYTMQSEYPCISFFFILIFLIYFPCGNLKGFHSQDFLPQGKFTGESNLNYPEGPEGVI